MSLRLKHLYIIFVLLQDVGQISLMTSVKYWVKMGLNPWQVESIHAFNFFCCPECVYRSKEEFDFQAHALHNHPESYFLFNKRSDETKYGNKTELDGNCNDEHEDHCLETSQSLPDNIRNVDDNSSKQEIFSESCEGLGKAIEHKCFKCDKKYSSLVDLGVHLNNDHERTSKETYQCPACIKSHATSTKLRLHIESVHLKVKSKCPVCQKMVSPNNLRIHMEVAHKSDKVNKPFKCDECEFSSHAKKYLKQHISNCHKRDAFQHGCDQCDKKFAFPSLLQEHKLAVHQGLKTYMCDQCGKGFPKGSKSLFEKHVKYDCNPPVKSKPIAMESIPCSACEMSFAAKCNYIQHFQSAHGSLPPNYKDIELFMCEQCSKLFTTNQSLKSHVLNVHSTNQSAKKKRSCPHCDKSFTQSAAYNEHIKVKHEKNMPFKCDQCHRSYGTRFGLRGHIINVHQRVKCKDCGQEICNAFMLKRHMASVHGIKPSNVHQCKHCPLFYRIKSILAKHVAKHHPMIESF